MTEMIQLTHKELGRAKMLALVAEGHTSVEAAAEAMSVSPRQVRRLLRRFEKDGAAALAHGNRGRSASNQVAPELRERILKLVEEQYADFNDTHLHEVLREREGLRVGRETLRKMLRSAGIGPKRRRRPRQHRRRREPRECRGMMIQWDGSHHAWFGADRPKAVLMAAVDDADGCMVGALFVPSESSAAYFHLLDSVLERRGIPLSVYQDRHGALRRNDGHWSLAEQLAGEQSPTQVGQALRDLGIQPIYARSAQGKGRIERFFGVAQDRLIAEMRLRGIASLEEGNAYLRDHWISAFNQRFGRAPKGTQSVYRSRRGVDRQKILSFRYERTVSNDNTVLLGDLVIQIPPGPRRRSYAKARVDVRQHLDGSWSVYHEEHRIAEHAATPLHEPKRARVKTRRTRPAKGADETTLVYFIPTQNELAAEALVHG